MKKPLITCLIFIALPAMALTYVNKTLEITDSDIRGQVKNIVSKCLGDQAIPMSYKAIKVYSNAHSISYVDAAKALCASKVFTNQESIVSQDGTWEEEVEVE